MNSFNHKISTLILIISVLITVALGNVEVDYAVFKGNQDISIVEVYYSMPRDMFEFKKIEDTDYFQSKILIRTIFSKEDSVVNWKQWTLVDNLTDTTINMRGQLIPDVRSFQLPPDDYEISVIVGDRITGEKKTFRENVKVDSFPKGELAASDLCLGTHIQKTNKENKFSKYFGYDLIPSANLIFGEINPVIYPYYEIYNMKETGSKRYLVNYTIEDADGKAVREVDWITKKKPGKTAVEVYLPGIKTKGLASGSYNLISRVIDRTNKDSVKLNKQIFIVNMPKNQYTGMNINKLKGYNEAQLDSIYGPMKYIATRKEKRVYRDLSTSGKRKFLSNFWKGRDPNPKTVVNEAQRNFENLVILANNKFSHGSKDGWETDRGRILLKYGRPDEIDRHESSIDKKPYRIWIYHDVQGGVKFVFVDIEGFSRYELVHSNARNELHDNNWQRYIEMTQF